jgi:hypothetical protein
LLRNFTGPKARLKSGPDVFADALVPRNGSRSPERLALRWPCLRRPALRSFQIVYRPVPTPTACTGLWQIAVMRHRASVSRARRQSTIGTLANTRSFVCADDGACEARDVAMVIVVRNGRVNRTSRILTSCCGIAIFAISSLPRGARVYTPFIAIFKLPFKFDRS